MYENESLIEIAIEQMEKKRKPHTIQSITKDVFEMKGKKLNECKEEVSQFEIDFMLCGNFICCGEDKKGNKLWDLKERQHHELLDKEGVYLEDLYDDDEDVIKNELKDDFDYAQASETDYDSDFNQVVPEEEEEEEEKEEKDDIEEELLMNDIGYDEDDSEEDKYDDDDSDK